MPLTHAVNTQDRYQGSLEAPIILVQYGDFQCPYSGAAYETVQEVQAQFGERLCYVFRHFPLHDIHPQALLASEAAEAAAAQGRFWPMYDLLFSNQHALGAHDLVGYAMQLGLDEGQFIDEMKSQTHREKVLQSVQQGRESGARGTPTFFINGTFYGNREGLWNTEVLLTAIEKVTRAAG